MRTQIGSSFSLSYMVGGVNEQSEPAGNEAVTHKTALHNTISH